LLRRDLDANAPAAAALEPVLAQLAARCLAETKAAESEQKPVIDPVARFYLENGARREPSTGSAIPRRTG
jgi:hypothetical protein